MAKLGPRAWFGCFDNVLRRGLGTLVAALVLAGGCNAKLRETRSPNSEAVRPTKDAGPALMLDATAADAADMSCAEEAHETGLMPLDILLLIDRGYSSDTPIPGSEVTRWVLLREVLLNFLRDPRSAGLNVGFQFMPWVGDKPVCESDEDCPGSLRGPVANCLPVKVCQGPLPYTCGMVAGATGPDDCGTDKKCIVGQCSLSGHDCFELGKDCPGGLAGNLCQPRKRLCRGYSLFCDYPKYEKLPVDFSPLPEKVAPLTERLLQTAPAGLSNIGPAVDGSLKVLKARLADPANANHRAALVMITDGLPTITCLPPSATLVADLMAEALASKPAIPSYILGVLGDETKDPKILPGWKEMAMKGGTKEPFIVKPDAEFLTKFQAVLDEIRGRALPCEFNIPAMSAGPLDYAKVNFTLKSKTGEQRVRYVRKPDSCDATAGGWYYDVDPTATDAGATPSRVIACAATCNQLKSDTAVKIDLRYGCKTIGID
jgi:hypothetical protein